MTWLVGRVFLPGAALFSCLVLVGCSSAQQCTVVQGKVTWKGQAPNLDGLRISFIGPDSKAVTVEVARSGEYKANVLPGRNLVIVFWQPPDDQNPYRAGKPKRDGNSPPPGEGPASRDAKELLKSPIPLRYGAPATSGLKYDIEGDKTNTYDVDLVE